LRVFRRHAAHPISNRTAWRLDRLLGHIGRVGQEVFEAEVTAAGFEKVGEVKDVLKENYFVKFRRK
jgi:predicted thioredoxin/glutaredoxin